MTGFTHAPLSDVADVKSGYAFKSSDWKSSGIPVIKIANVHPGNIDLTGCSFVDETVAMSASAFRVRRGDPLIAMSGASVGEIGRVRFTDKALVNQRVGVFRVKDPNLLDEDFLYHFLQLPDTVGYFVSSAYGSAQPNISPSLILSVDIPLPPIAEQRAIGEVLGALDDKIAANSRLANQSFHLAESLFASVLSRADAYASLSELAITVLGGTPSRDVAEYWTGGTVPWLNSGKANEDRIVSPSEYITETALAKSAAKLMPAGATLIAITGATLGQVARLEIPASGNQSLVGIWSEDSKMTDWLHFAVRAQIPELLKRATGAAQQHVNKRDVDSLQVPLVSAVELGSFSRRASPLLELAAVADRENESLAATRDALLPQLMSGKLRVKDAEQLVEKVA
ncbi:restriction endonuclease subunit S [Cryobacterium tepidiphilum]|uniref:Type I restriction modification DNA specificity domain-containing protein n=1 Tax=Cryobacterium tepidiphilum TaxID=2486026 RepID=A0A3M8LMN6_9MICO|nr:restriction endonuclease subunit S [Cryobacterium tepidiphilum]RNE66740.1 hypothetical protein EEJ31_02855 [Cryobacterium tepidiphilum]